MKDFGQFSGIETSSITGLLTTLIPSFCKIVASLSEFNVETNFGPLFIGRLSKISVSGKFDSNSDKRPWYTKLGKGNPRENISFQFIGEICTYAESPETFIPAGYRQPPPIDCNIFLSELTSFSVSS